MEARARREILPAALITAAVVLAPFLVLLWQSARDLNYFEGRNQLVGLRNYQELANDPAFRSSLEVTARYAFFAAVFSVAAGLLASLALYFSPLGRRLSSVLLAPFFTAPIVVALIFALLLDGQLGLAPHVLAWFGASEPDNIVGHPVRVFWALVAIDAWQWFGVFALVFHARMSRIPRRSYELVASSGGGALRKIRDVWLPAMTPVIVAVALFKLLWALGDAERIDALTAGGGPHGAMRVFSIWMNRTYFLYADYGYGAAAGVILYLAALISVRFFLSLLERRGERV